MVDNLRVSSITAVSSLEINATFTAPLNPNITVGNIEILSQTPGVPNPEIRKVKVATNSLQISILPLTALAVYTVAFKSTSEVKFNSLNTEALLLEDGIANKQFLIAPVDSTNHAKEYILNYLRENVYNTEDGTVLSAYINTLSTILSTALYDIRQAKNENYLSITIKDEQKTRSAGAFDRLNEESAYEIIRVGKTPSGSSSILSLDFNEFPTDPVTLLRAASSESLSISSLDKSGNFNINTFILTLSKRFITKINSIIFTYSDGHLAYTYDVTKYGYQILDAKYDSNFAFKYLQLTNNQVRLNDKILEDVNFSLKSIFKIQVSYEYKDTGRSIDFSTLTVNSVLSSGREVLPPLRNVFNLRHAPIVNANNVAGKIGDITFVNQNSLPTLQEKHPSFKTEIKFRMEAPPGNVGEYSVDYATGTVYVFGATKTNDGTGDTPPLAVYSYRLEYKEDIDWVVNESTNDLVPLPAGSLIGQTATIKFSYEQVLAAGLDYNANIHQEVLDERIENRLVALNAFTVKNSPVTDVFRIYNETSGEIYRTVRWNGNKVFFSYLKPPKIESVIKERGSFELINNEVLFVNSVLDTAQPTIKIFKILLNNNNIIGRTEDCIGTMFNSSISLSNGTIFKQEVYFNTSQTEATNLTRLTTVGNYFINYQNGIVYVAVTSTQNFNIGTVSYRRGYIVPSKPHLTSIEDIYYQINALASKEAHFDYISFTDGSILPKKIDLADEQILSGNASLTYSVFGNKIGTFSSGSFLAGITSSPKFVRSLYEIEDLLNNTLPVNFAPAVVVNDKIITVNPIEYKEYHSVEGSTGNFFVILNTGLKYRSPNINLTISVVRVSDSQNLWNSSGTIELGNLIKLVLPGVGSPANGNSVLVTYTYTVKDLSHIVIDYNRGDYYIDYSALTDEIVVSYEHGDNALDFRISNALNTGDTYYVTYKTGALRDALLRNFGSLINISLFNTFDITFNRERYRDALMAAMHSFSKGPTVDAIKEIALTISHLPAEVSESIFQNWSLGHSLLAQHELETKGTFSLVPVKYGNGVLINKSDQEIKLPLASNLKLEQGTFETWIKPSWNGLDNLADLTITLSKDGYVASELEVFIGGLEYHPIYKTDAKGTKYFTLDKNQRVIGTPNKNKDGIYIYYDKDVAGSFDRWYVEVLDGYANDGYDGYDGYADGYTTKKYSIAITTNGRFYDIKSTKNPKPSSSKITSSNAKITFNVTSAFPNEGITFLADLQHYILDFAEEENKNRFSIFKDESGYLNFKVLDKLKNAYVVSADVSKWKAGDLHHVAASWNLNTKMGRDELHLFIDGFEVPNILRYGDRIKPYLHEKYRTVNPEEIVGVITKNIVGSNDLTTVAGSTQVVSSINFSNFGIVAGHTIFIEETGFSQSSYTITNVNGNTLTLSTTMPLTISNGRFSVNRTNLNVETEIDIFPNFAVYLVHSIFGSTDLSTIDGYNVVSSATTNFISKGVIAGDFIRINNAQFEKHYTIVSFTSSTLTLNDNMPVTASGLSFNLYHNEEEEIPGLRAIKPAYSLSKDGYFNNILSIKDQAEVNDLVLIRTLGINHRRVKRRYYVWGNQQHILKTKLPAPISLDEAKFFKVLLPPTFIGPGNATLVDGYFSSNNILTEQPFDAAGGRTIGVNIKGDNINFSIPTEVNIVGLVVNNIGTISAGSETLLFTEPGTVYTTKFFAQVDYIKIKCKPINSTKNCAVVELKERYSITRVENIGAFDDLSTTPKPIIRYSYQVGIGNKLFSDGYTVGKGWEVSDNANFFSDDVVDDYLLIHSPSSAAGYYKITDVSSNHKSLTIISLLDETALPAFTDGYYEILDTTTFRSGLQNGFFSFEHAYLPGEIFVLSQGWYELDYYTYLQAPMNIGTNYMHIGTDFNGKNQLYGSLDALQILNTKLTDTRIGETAAKTQRTITKEFNKLKASKPDISSLVLTDFERLPPVNFADVYRSAERDIFQSGIVINDNFKRSICLTERPLIIDNNGILDTKKEATIEFWINPIFDTHNDSNYRFYFDGYGAVTESLISTNSTTIDLKGKADQVLSIKIADSPAEINYFAGGQIAGSGKQLILHKSLPNQNTAVNVTYIPNGLVGDRISLFKDPSGYLNFNITANSIDYQVRVPAFWSRNTWHRVKASYKINSGSKLDEMHLILDGYERGNVVFGTNLLFGQGLVFGSSFAGPTNLKHDIKFKDPINRLVIGADFESNNKSYALFDNIRISNIARPLYQPFGEPIDPNYSSNLSAVQPITEDLYTTLLINFDTLVTKNNDFAMLFDKRSGQSDFSLTILDTLGILSNSNRTKEVLEALIKSFKPANSRSYIKYA